MRRGGAGGAAAKAPLPLVLVLVLVLREEEAPGVTERRMQEPSLSLFSARVLVSSLSMRPAKTSRCDWGGTCKVLLAICAYGGQ